MINETKLIEGLEKEWWKLVDYSENVEVLLEYVKKFIDAQPKQPQISTPIPQGGFASKKELRPCIVKTCGKYETARYAGSVYNGSESENKEEGQGKGN